MTVSFIIGVLAGALVAVICLLVKSRRDVARLKSIKFDLLQAKYIVTESDYNSSPSSKTRREKIDKALLFQLSDGLGKYVNGKADKAVDPETGNTVLTYKFLIKRI